MLNCAGDAFLRTLKAHQEGKLSDKNSLAGSSAILEERPLESARQNPGWVAHVPHNIESNYEEGGSEEDKYDTNDGFCVSDDTSEDSNEVRIRHTALATVESGRIIQYTNEKNDVYSLVCR